MRKLILWLAAVIVLLLLFLYVFLAYRQRSSYNIPIHPNADVVIKLNTDEFIKTWIWDEGFSFSSSKKKDTVQKEEEPPIGLRIPANIFIYSVTGKKEGTFFCLLPVKNRTQLEKYLQQKMKLQVSSNASTFTAGGNQKMQLLGNDHFVAVSFSATGEETMDVLQQMLGSKTTVSSNKNLHAKLKQTSAHILVLAKEITATFELNGKDLLAGATLQQENNYFTIPAATVQTPFSDTACGWFYINALPKPGTLKDTYRIKQYSLVTSQWLPFYKGYAAAELGSSTTQQDTVTTYGYDDNFQMKEQQTITETKVPAITVSFLADAQPFYNYLQQQQWVTDSSRVNKTIFPLYDAHVAYTKDMLTAGTAAQTKKEQPVSTTADFMGLMIDVSKTAAVHDFPYFATYTKGITSLEVKGTKGTNDQIILNGKLHFSKNAVKALAELAEQFR